MREFRSYGSVRGAPSNRRPYRDHQLDNEIDRHGERVASTSNQHLHRPPVPSFRRSLLIIYAAVLGSPALHAQQIDPRMYSEMRWRMIGPHRASRTKAAVGIPDQPNVFYIGAVNGGIWKTTDYGRTWTPIFDDQPSGSIGAIAVAPSDPSVIYVG